MPNFRQWMNILTVQQFIKTVKKDLSYYVTKIEQNIPYSFSRFGDGEWAAIFGQEGANCDGHTYFPEMGKQLSETLIHPLDYEYAIQRLAKKTFGIKISMFLRQTTKKITWYDSDIFHHSNSDALFSPMIQALRNKKCVIIGPPHLRDLNKETLPYDHFIEIPIKNCFLEIDRIEKDILKYGMNKKSIVFIFCASMPANILIHRLFPILGKNNWLIDFGSVWDIYVNVKTREMYNKTKWKSIVQNNLNKQ